MPPQAPDTPLLELVLQRGLLTEAGLAALHAPPPENPTEPAEYRYGPSIDRLVRARHLDEAVVRALLAELTALADTRDGHRAPPRPTSSLPGVPGPGSAPPEERYELRRLLGRGGMGSVHEAHDRKLGRTVALKLLHDQDERTTLRLLREAQSQARVRHPNVCEVYDVGVRAGQPYVAMEYLAGQPLHEARPHLTLEEKVHITRQIAEALEAAHRIGIVHRDVKPSNVMVERKRDGCWWATMMDFGLARGPGQGEHLTVTGTVLGTPAYMPPEQARGNADPTDCRADVYGLGALLYHLLVGEPPFSEPTVEQVLLRVIHEEPLSPRRKVPSLPAELEILTLKCLRKEVGERYASAQAVADDLGRYLEGRPLLARKASWPYRARKWAQRHRVLVALAGMGLLGAGGIVAGEVRAQRQADRQTRLAQRLGREVESSDLFLRAAYALPLHDVRREEGVVRARMDSIAAELVGLSGREAALAHHALGRAHLALREDAEAVRHLQAALDLGLEDGEVHLALGRALGEQYARAREEAEQLGDKRALEARLQEIDETLLAPARRQLREGMSLSPEPRPFEEGLLALYSQEYGTAQRKAEEALQREVWRSEARKLAADTAYFQGLHQLLRTEHDAARASFERADGLYRTASDMARSDASLYLAQARLWKQRMVLDMYQGRPPDAAAERMREACRFLAVASPGEVEAEDLEYAASTTLARYAMEHGGDPRAHLEAALTAAQRAVELTPRDASRERSLAEAHLTRAWVEAQRGGEAEAPLQLAEAHALEAARLRPDSQWSWSTLGNVHGIHALWLLEQGRDARPRILEAIAAYKKAITSAVNLAAAYEQLAHGYYVLAGYELEQGRALDALASEASSLLDRAIGLTPGNALLYRYRGAISAAWAESLHLTGGKPEGLLVAARADLTKALELKPNDAESHLWLSRVHRLNADLAARSGEDPSPLLAEALREAEQAVQLNPGEGACRLERSRVWALLARQERRRGHSPMALLDKARSALAPVSGSAVQQARTHVLLADLALERAEGLPREKRRREDAVAEGLAHVERALQRWPGMPQALRTRGALLLQEAQTEPVPAERRRLLELARASLEAAWEGNPLLRLEIDELLTEVRRRLELASP